MLVVQPWDCVCPSQRALGPCCLPSPCTWPCAWAAFRGRRGWACHLLFMSCVPGPVCFYHRWLQHVPMGGHFIRFVSSYVSSSVSRYTCGCSCVSCSMDLGCVAISTNRKSVLINHRVWKCLFLYF